MQRVIVVIKPGKQLDLSAPVVEGIVACCTCRLKQWLVVVHLSFVATGGSFVLALRLHCCRSHGSECRLKSVKWLASCSSLYENSLSHSFIRPTLYFCRDRLLDHSCRHDHQRSRVESGARRRYQEGLRRQRMLEWPGPHYLSAPLQFQCHRTVAVGRCRDLQTYGSSVGVAWKHQSGV